MSLNCEKCRQAILRKDFIKCLNCHKHYHLDCTSIGEKLFYLMKPENRKKCQCDGCRYKKAHITTTFQDGINVPTENSFEGLSEEESNNDVDLNFVTIRGAKKKTASLPDLSESLLSPTPETVNCSHPRAGNTERSAQVSLDGGTDQNSIVDKLKDEISELQCKLKLANINIKKLTMTIKNLKNKDKGQGKVNTSTPTRKNKQKVNVIQPEAFMGPSTSNKQPKIRSVDTGILDRDYYKHKKIPGNDRKICLISSVGREKVSRIIRSNFEEHELCHYRIPGGGINQLLSGIDAKLQHYTLNDYCVLFLGEADFSVSKNYRQLVIQIRERLLSVQHTNIILCLPTFKFSLQANIYNRRIEMFNKLIYSDNLNYNYCYLLDSNKNLNYSFDMFLRYGGQINIRGLKTVLNDINELIFNIDIELISSENRQEEDLSDSSFSTSQESVIESGRPSFRA